MLVLKCLLCPLSVPHSSDEDEFFEAVEHQIEEFSVALPYDKTHRFVTFC